MRRRWPGKFSPVRTARTAVLEPVVEATVAEAAKGEAVVEVPEVMQTVFPVHKHQRADAKADWRTQSQGS